MRIQNMGVRKEMVNSLNALNSLQKCLPKKKNSCMSSQTPQNCTYNSHTVYVRPKMKQSSYKLGRRETINKNFAANFRR